MMRQNTTKGPLGTVRISDEAIAAIAAVATKDIQGVVNLHGNILDFIVELLGKNLDYKGIKVDLLGKDVIIEISVCVKYGVDIADVTSEIQEKVRNSVESMTGLSVNSVNVNISTVKK